MPTKEEERLLLSFSGDKTKLGNAEKVREILAHGGVTAGVHVEGGLLVVG